MPDHPNTDPLDILVDVVCELPHEVEKFESSIQICRSHDVSAMEALLEVLATIFEWQSHLRQSSNAQLYSAKPAQLTNPADDSYEGPLFPFALNFRSIRIGTYFVLSWGLQLQICATLLNAPEEMLQHVRDITPWAVTSSSAEIDGSPPTLRRVLKAEADRIARLLCQTVEYCHRPEMGIFGPQTMLYTQWMMRSYFRQVEAGRELQWCLNIPNMRGAPTRCSIRTMSFEGAKV